MKREITSIQHPQSLFAKDYKAKQDPSSLMEPTNGHCARKSFTVNFDEIGWSHILAPKQVWPLANQSSQSSYKIS